LQEGKTFLTIRQFEEQSFLKVCRLNEALTT
jgi:hypothetical protein